MWGDAQHLAHVVVNLVVNALEALPDAGCGVHVSTRYASEEHRLVLEVADQGVGIAPQHLARLCDPFLPPKLPGVVPGWAWRLRPPWCTPMADG